MKWKGARMGMNRGLLCTLVFLGAQFAGAFPLGAAESTNLPGDPAPQKAPELQPDSVVEERTNTAVADAAIPAAPPQKSPVAGFQTRPGFKIELVASSPAVSSPVAMAFDEDGRLFVAEMRDYPAQATKTPHLGQIRVLEDPQGEGVFSASTIFATNLALPSAVVCYGGGVFVAAGRDIVFLQDTDGNGVADVRRLIFTGFGGTNVLPNPNALPHSFYWGLDNRIYGGSGGSGGSIRADGAESAVSIAGNDFSFDPRTLDFRAESGPSLSGMTRDDWGRRYLCDPTRPVRLDLLPDRYLSRNPFFVPARAAVELTEPAVPVYRYTPPANPAPKAVRGTYVVATSWLASARGSVIYRGNLFPSNYLGNLFVAAPESHLIHRSVLREQGFAVRAERAPDEQATEFLVSTDETFRPTQIANGPDGALYVSDMMNGGDSGRIYRISTSGFTPSKPPKLSRSKPAELVALLAQTNGWHRDTAARLLCERRDAAAAPLLASMFANSRLPLARAHAQMALAGMGVLTDVQTARGMGDPDWHVRRQSAELVEGLIQQGRVSDSLWSRLRSLAGEPYAQVRLQAALSAGSVTRPDKGALLRDALARDPANEWVQSAVLSSAITGGAALAQLVVTEARIPEQVRAPFLARLADMAGCSGIMEEVSPLVNYIAGPQLPQAVAFNTAAALGEGLQRTRSSLRLVDAEGLLRGVFAAALRVADSPGATMDVRLAAIRLLGVGPYTMNDGGRILLAIVGSTEPVEIQSAALRSLERYISPELAPEIIRKWRGIPPALRGQAVQTLMARTDQVPIVLTLVEAGSIPAADVLPWQANLLRHWPEPAVAQRAARIFGSASPNRTPALQRLLPVMARNGVPGRGRAVFAARCSACHTMQGFVQTPGPDLSGVKIFGKDAILESIIMPSQSIRPGYAAVVLNAGSGETLVGTAGSEHPDAVVFRQPGREPVAWPRSNIESFQVQSWSLMPDGLEQGLSDQNVADLVQFLVSSP